MTLNYFIYYCQLLFTYDVIKWVAQPKKKYTPANFTLHTMRKQKIYRNLVTPKTATELLYSTLLNKPLHFLSKRERSNTIHFKRHFYPFLLGLEMYFIWNTNKKSYIPVKMSYKTSLYGIPFSRYWNLAESAFFAQFSQFLGWAKKCKVEHYYLYYDIS